MAGDIDWALADGATVIVGTAVACVMALSLVYASHRCIRPLKLIEVKAHNFIKSSVPASEFERRAWLVEMNEVTLDMSHTLAQPSLIPRACARIAFCAGGLVALVLVATTLQTQPAQGSRGGGWQMATVAFLVGVAGAFGCRAVGRLAEQKAGKIREEWNSLIRRSTQDVPT